MDTHLDKLAYDRLFPGGKARCRTGICGVNADYTQTDLSGQEGTIISIHGNCAKWRPDNPKLLPRWLPTMSGTEWTVSISDLEPVAEFPTLASLLEEFRKCLP